MSATEAGASSRRGRLPCVAVVGGSDPAEADRIVAYEVGRLLARAGVVTVCGGLGGVMEAAARGATEAGGLTLGLLPGDDPRDANPWIQVALPTGFGEARNALVVRSATVIIAIGGAWGTLSEIALARASGRHVITVGTPPADGMALPAAAGASEAVAWALDRISGPVAG